MTSRISPVFAQTRSPVLRARMPLLKKLSDEPSQNALQTSLMLTFTGTFVLSSHGSCSHLSAICRAMLVW